MLSEKVTLISLGRSDGQYQLGTPRCNAPIIIKNIPFPMSDIYCPMSNDYYWVCTGYSTSSVQQWARLLLHLCWHFFQLIPGLTLTPLTYCQPGFTVIDICSTIICKLVVVVLYRFLGAFEHLLIIIVISTARLAASCIVGLIWEINESTLWRDEHKRPLHGAGGEGCLHCEGRSSLRKTG